ncbi:Bro-N domain-containing protein [Patescibacteria group bacterium]|nr:Bro-N domain-containing protein [Patescibacteria group bacterium]MBU1885967.1 Bro-N domain-containing protein [Patescibacteria group bacterium]
MTQTKISVFEGKRIRKKFYQGEWWFSIIDVIGVLIESSRSRKYWNDLKNKLIDEGYFEVSENIGQLKMESSDGKKYKTDCANTETIFRIIQSIPSKKAEPFKLWLAKVGYERGGGVAGNARKDTEKELGQSTISDENYLDAGDQIKKLEFNEN